MIKLDILPFRPKSEPNLYYISISIDQIDVKSPPQSIRSTCADLVANGRFLRDYSLTAFFVGNEPLIQVKICDAGLAYCQMSKGDLSSRIWYRGSFLISEGLNEINRTISVFMSNNIITNFNRDDLEKQVNEDTNLGVFNPFVRMNGIYN
jgi:hypothetical protein